MTRCSNVWKYVKFVEKGMKNGLSDKSWREEFLNENFVQIVWKCTVPFHALSWLFAGQSDDSGSEIGHSKQRWFGHDSGAALVKAAWPCRLDEAPARWVLLVIGVLGEVWGWVGWPRVCRAVMVGKRARLSSSSSSSCGSPRLPSLFAVEAPPPPPNVAPFAAGGRFWGRRTASPPRQRGSGPHLVPERVPYRGPVAGCVLPPQVLRLLAPPAGVGSHVCIFSTSFLPSFPSSHGVQPQRPSSW